MFIELDVWNAVRNSTWKRLIHVNTIKYIEPMVNSANGSMIKLKNKKERIEVEQTYGEIEDRLDQVKLLV